MEWSSKNSFQSDANEKQAKYNPIASGKQTLPELIIQRQGVIFFRALSPMLYHVLCF